MLAKLAPNSVFAHKEVVELKKVHDIEISHVVECFDLLVRVQVPNQGPVLKVYLDQLLLTGGLQLCQAVEVEVLNQANFKVAH